MKNQIKKLLSLALVVAMCLSTLALCVSAETCAHANKIQTSTTEATCLGYGYTSYKCADCGADFVENLVNPLGHDWSEETTTAATCENKAGTKKECKRCDAEDVKPGASTGKTCKMGDPEFKVIEGVLTKVETCTVCGNVKTSAVSADHSHEVEHSNMVMVEETLVKPTCDAKGSVDYKCSVEECGFVVTVEIQENHQLTKHDAKLHTCEEDGNFEYWTCDLCEAYFMMVKAEGATTATMTKVDAAAIVDKAAHDLKKGDTPKIVEDCTPGIEQKAVYTWVCQADDCEYTEDREEADFTHKFVYDEAKSFAPTCVKYGLYVEYCEVCGKNKSETKNPLGFLVKDDADNTKDVYKTLAQLKGDQATIDAYAEKVEAPCGGKAKYVYTVLAKCTDANCDCQDGKVEIEYGDKKEHPYVKVSDAVAPTCTQPGKKALYECPVCKEAGAAEYVDPERDGSTIEALGHEWSEVIEYCSVEDKAILKCTVCGGLDEEWLTPAELEELEFVKPEGESHVTLYKEYVAPSCTEDGYKVTYCFACHWTDEEEPIKATGHNIDLQGEYFVQAGSCQQQTLHIYSCQNEGCSYNEAYPQGKDTTVAGHIAAMGTLPTGTVLRPATCTTRSLTQYTCTLCGVTFTILGDEDDYGTHEVVERTEAPICAIAQNGKVGLYCTDCDKWIEFEEIPFAHDTEGTVAARPVCLPETEFTANPYGWDAFTYCAACEAYETDETIVKDEDFEMALESKQAMTLKNRKAAHKSDIKTSEMIDSTCDAVGVKEFTYCVGCGDDAAKIIAEAKKSETYKWNDVVLQIAKKDHMKKADAAVVATCTTFGYKLTYCEFCSDALIVDFDYENGHAWEIPEDEEDVLTENLDDKADDYDCTEKGYKYYECENCTETYKFDIVEPHHVDADGNKVFDCTDAEEDFTCIHGCDVKVEDLHDYQSDVDDIKLPTCTEPGWKISICRICGAQEDLTPGEEGNILVLPPVGHHSIWFDEEEETWFYYVYVNIADEDEEPVMDWVAVEADSLEEAVLLSGVELVEDKCVDATHTADGKLVILCAVCDEEVEFVVDQLVGIDLDITADNAIVPGAPIVNGGKVQFTVVINANDVDAAGLKADFFYDASVLEFIAAESFVSPIFDATIDGKTVVTSSKIGTPKVTTVMGESLGQITVTALASKTEGGTSVDVNFNGTEIAFATFTFRVAANAEYSSEFYGLVSELTTAKGEMLVDVDVNSIIAYTAYSAKLAALQSKYATELAAFTVAAEYELLAEEFLAEAEGILADAKEELEVAEGVVELAEATLELAQTALAEAQAALDAAPEGTDTTAAEGLVAEAQAAVTAAETVLAAAQTELVAAQTAVEGAQASVDAAEAELTAAQTVLAKAEKDLAKYNEEYEALYEEYEDVVDSFEYVDIFNFMMAIQNAYVDFEIAKLGDVNGDDAINLADVVAILKMQFTNMDGVITEGEYALPTGKQTEDGEDILAEVNYLATADFDMDGDVDLIDYALINQYIVNDITYEQLVLTSQAAAE